MRCGVFLLAIGAVACRGNHRTNGSSVTDSAGVRLVTSTAPAWGDTSRWMLDTVPLLSIGDASGPNPILLVEVNGTRLLPDGRVAVVSGSEKTVLYFDAQGKPAGRVGRDGAGPGEFRSVDLIGNLGDSLLIWDAQLARSTLLDPAGKVARNFSVSKGDSAMTPRFGFAPAALFADGSLLVAGRAGASTGDRSELRRDTVPLRHADARGTLGHPIADVLGSEAIVVVGKKFVSRFDRPFGRTTITGTTGISTLVSTGDFDGLVVYDTAGQLTARYRLDRPRRLIPASDIDALGQEQGQQLTQLPKEFAAALRPVLAEIGVPATLATADQLVVDASGAIWLRNAVGPVRRDSLAQRWTVLSADGSWLGSVTTPRRLEVHQITADRIIGVWRDENDVEYVRIYRLTRTP